VKQLANGVVQLLGGYPMKQLILASFLTTGLIMAQVPGSQSSSETTVTQEKRDGNKVKTNTNRVRTDSNTDATGSTTSTTNSNSTQTEAKTKHHGKETKVKEHRSGNTSTTTTSPSNP